MYLVAVLRKSSTEFAILGLLTVEPMSGYDLRKHFSESLVYFWNESYGQIYPTLKRLAKDGFIAPVVARKAEIRERRLYTLTPAGRAHLREWLGRPPQQQPICNEFLLKLFLGRSAPTGATVGHIRRFRTEQEELLAMFFIIRDSVRVEHAKSPNLTFWMLGITHGINIRRAEIDWCNEALRVLEPHSPQSKTIRRKSAPLKLR